MQLFKFLTEKTCFEPGVKEAIYVDYERRSLNTATVLRSFPRHFNPHMPLASGDLNRVGQCLIKVSPTDPSDGNDLHLTRMMSSGSTTLITPPKGKALTNG